MSKKELEKLWKELEQEDEAQLLEFKEIRIEFCSQTKHYLSKKAWVPYEDRDQIIVQEALKKIRNPKKIPLEITPDYSSLQNGELQCKPGLEQEIILEVRTPQNVYEIPTTIAFTLCPKVAKKGTDYFEGVFQVRGSQELINRAKNLIIEGGAHINKEIKQPGGVDFQVTSKKVMRRVGKQLCKEYVGEYKESPRLFSRDKQTSKDIYRLNCFFKEQQWKVGDIVEVNGEKVKITTLGRKPYGKSVTTGKKIYL
jgi:NMD protein affecting ribosome stability and mRNA decay